MVQKVVWKNNPTCWSWLERKWLVMDRCKCELRQIFINVSKFSGMETSCDGRQDGTQCYGALGGTVDIQLMDNTAEIPRYDLSKNSSKILTVRNNTFSSNKHRYLFPSNGTFRINNLSRSDSGNYTLQTFDSDGRSSGERTLQLFIQGKCFPVGKLSH
uniref:Immunoglobulin subtype domain-containing protein n=1 Tax=Oreochromis aureus TaxID=47969 RepID=A0A668RSJ8_OREAU